MTHLSGWGEFIAAFAVFLMSHSIPVRPTVRAGLVARLGRSGFTLAYSALSLAALAWLIVAARRAPEIVLWPWGLWQNHVTFLAMAAAVAIAALAIGRPNPLSFGGAHDDRYDPERPGIVGWIRHPLLAALLLWSAGHILPNGILALVILFGLFAGFCLLGMRLIDRRKRRQMGRAEWQRLASARREIHPSKQGILRLILAAGIYLLLIHLHSPVIGIAPVF